MPGNDATNSWVRSSEGALSITKISNLSARVCKFSKDCKQRAKETGRSLVQIATVSDGNSTTLTGGINSSRILS